MSAKVVINAGGSKTTVVVKARSGSLGTDTRRSIVLSGGNINTIAETGLKQLVAEISDFVGTDRSSAKLLAGFAGAACKEDFDLIERVLRQHEFLGDIAVCSDFELYLKLLPDNSALLISGTGCVGVGRAGSKLIRVGGWGPLSGEPGSGLQLGREAILFSLLSSEGREMKSTLPERIAEGLKLERIAKVVKPLHAGKYSNAEIAALSVIAFAAARAGDELANKLIKNVADGLGSIVQALSDQLGTNCKILGLGGGLFEGHSRDLLWRQLRPKIRADLEFRFFGDGPGDINLVDRLIESL